MLQMIGLVLASALAQGESAVPAPGVQEAAEARPVLPGEKGHILKMTREMIELAKTHDSERRMDLFLKHAQERLRERERLEKETPGADRERLGRELGQSYARLVSTGAAGTIECGAAEGRDMNPAGARYIERTRQDREGWERVLAVVPPEERSHYDAALEVSGKAPARVREAQEAGQTFFQQERLKEEARKREKASEAPKTPAPLEKTPAPAPAKTPETPAAPVEPARKPSDGDRRDGDRKDSDPDSARRDDAPKPEHHPSHPHRPHR
ncbi:MAG TPA: hypothetical protein VMU54_22265 [Planctomycetota bacterium]|nr:hypothetical protein [Planctomycetota bacterium]